MNKEISTPRIEEMAKDFCKNTPRMKQEGGVTFYNRLVVVLTEAHQAGKDEAVEIFERFIEDIPEAYGWGEKDKEADRGYQICSKNVKAIGRSLIKALQDNK